MQKLIRKLRRTAKKIFISTLIAASLMMIYLLSQIPVHTYKWMGATLVVSFCLWFMFKPQKYINERGYVFLVRENDLEHRFKAKQMLGRNLAQNEVVHHINGRKTDNKIQNLCLMDREKHEHFHAWLRWKKDKTGKYPSFSHQKQTLVNEYGGILIEDLVS